MSPSAVDLMTIYPLADPDAPLPGFDPAHVNRRRTSLLRGLFASIVGDHRWPSVN